jgi:hypothetical protein
VRRNSSCVNRTTGLTLRNVKTGPHIYPINFRNTPVDPVIPFAASGPHFAITNIAAPQTPSPSANRKIPTGASKSQFGNRDFFHSPPPTIAMIHSPERKLLPGSFPLLRAPRFLDARSSRKGILRQAHLCRTMVFRQKSGSR